MCTDKSETTQTIRMVLSRMKECLFEARQPLTRLAVQAVKRMFHLRKGKLNGEEDKASLNT